MNWEQLEIYVNEHGRTRAQLERVARTIGLSPDSKGDLLLHNINRRIQSRLKSEGPDAMSGVPLPASNRNSNQSSNGNNGSRRPPTRTPVQTPSNGGLGGNFFTNGGVWQAVVAIAAIVAIIVLAFWAYDEFIDDENGTSVPTSLAETTPTAEVSDDSSLSEAEVRKIAEEVAAEAATESGLSETEVQSLINDTLENISPVDGLSEAQVRRIVRAELMILLTQVPADRAAVSGSSNASGDNEQVSTGSMPVFTNETKNGSWTIKGTERLPENPVVAGWLSRLRNPNPSVWKTFPNVPNPDVAGFRVVNGSEVPDGMEYGTYSTPYCWSSPCDIPVGAWEYRYISGDYEFLGNSCKGDGQRGCMLVLVNVMDSSYTWRNQYVDNGFTLRGRYFNGDALEWGIWGLVSHGAANMLNMETFAHPGEVLNSGDPGNSGANCGTPAGCASVDVLVVVHAGDAIIATAHTVVTHP